jgi:DNA-binding transcriptional ArsR family regulator
MQKNADKNSLPDANALASLAKALADPRRIELMNLLADGQEHCVCHIAKTLSLPEFQVSRQLAPLKRLGLVVARRDGTWMHYHACATTCAPYFKALATLLQPVEFTRGSGEGCGLRSEGGSCGAP